VHLENLAVFNTLMEAGGPAVTLSWDKVKFDTSGDGKGDTTYDKYKPAAEAPSGF
jgi:hypothetical protein